jgi:SAM-dependent methyltransferase
VKDNNSIKPEKTKKLHYALVKKYFRKDAAKRKGYYDSKDIEELKYDLKKRKIWKIYTSTLDEILHKNAEIFNVIDVGCGMGNFTFELVHRKQFKKIVGIDFLTETFDIARENKKNFGKVSFIQGDLLNLPFTDESFDMTVCLNVLHHIHKDDFSKAIYELARITDKYLILEIRNKNNILKFWHNKIVLPHFNREIPVDANSVLEVNDLMKDYNFQLEIVRGKSVVRMICWHLLLVYKRIDKKFTPKVHILLLKSH